MPASMRSSPQKMPRELHDSVWTGIKGYPSWIAGIKYRGPDGTDRGKYCARNLSAGAVLDLVLEPDNLHSRWAVAIKHHGRHLGYVPERHHWVGCALREGKALSCVVNQMETEGWLFRRRARFVALDISVSDDQPARDIVDKEKRGRAREACISGLRVLAHIALSDDLWSENELAIQASYIGARLASAGFDRDDELTEIHAHAGASAFRVKAVIRPGAQ